MMPDMSPACLSRLRRARHGTRDPTANVGGVVVEKDAADPKLLEGLAKTVAAFAKIPIRG